MPPKPKFSREEIVSAALDIVTGHGPSALTARALGAQLGSSARPIFTVFENMEEVSQQVRLAATRQFQQYVRREIEGVPHFKAIGMNMVHFAMEKPRLFQLLYMQGNPDAEDLTLCFSIWMIWPPKASLPCGRNTGWISSGRKSCSSRCGSTPMASAPCALTGCAALLRRKYPICSPLPSRAC